MSSPIHNKLRLAGATAILFLSIPTIIFAATFVRPLGNVSIGNIIVNIINWLLGLAVLLAMLALVIGGIRLIFGGFDNEAEAARAKKIIFWSLAGLAVVVLSLTIINILSGILNF